MKRIICLILSLILLLSLCACGGQNDPENTDASNPVQSSSGDETPTSPADDYKPVRPSAKAYTLSEYLSKGESIWYVLDSAKGKDSKVLKILVLEPDGSMYISYLGKTLGELEQMEDSEIAEAIKQKYIDEAAIGLAHRDFSQYTKEEAMRIIAGNICGLAEPRINDNESTNVYKHYVKTKESIVQSIEDFDKDHYFSSDYVVEELIARVDKILAIAKPIDELAAKMLGRPEFEEQHYGIPYPDDNYFRALSNYYVTLDTESEGYIYLAKRIESIRNAGFDVELKAIENATKDLAKFVEEIYETVAKRIESDKALVQPGQYRLSIVSDSTGNRTESMKLHYQYTTDFARKNVSTISVKLDVSIPIDVGGNTCGMVVYDSVYGGYSVKGYTSKTNGLYTRAVEGMELNLDQIGKSKLPIDVKDVEARFNQ